MDWELQIYKIKKSNQKSAGGVAGVLFSLPKLVDVMTKNLLCVIFQKLYDKMKKWEKKWWKCLNALCVCFGFNEGKMEKMNSEKK